MTSKIKTPSKMKMTSKIKTTSKMNTTTSFRRLSPSGAYTTLVVLIFFTIDKMLVTAKLG